MKRRDFLSRTGSGLLAASALGPFWRAAPGLVRPAAWLLIPMDDSQSDHLKAYGVTYRVLERGGKGEWFLNYRGGSFLIPGDSAVARDAALSGVTAETDRRWSGGYHQGADPAGKHGCDPT
jgi:hypothetical protein